MSGRDKSRDPFAGYTPVQVSAVGCEQTDVPNPPKKYSFRKKEKRSFRRTLVGLVQVALFALAVLAVAVFSYGFIFRRTSVEPPSALGSLTNQVQRLAAFGWDVREALDKPVQTNAVPAADVPVATVVTNAPKAKVKESRQVDPALKRFYNGGRKGRTVGPKERK